MSYSDDRHEALLRQLSDLAAKRQLAANEEAARQQTEITNAERNPYAMSATGASAGSMFGPWGALIGGIGGGILGNVRDFQSRRKGGEGFWSALGGSAGDTLMPWKNKDLMNHPMDTIGRALPAAGALGQAFQKNQADNALSGSPVGGTSSVGESNTPTLQAPKLSLQQEYNVPTMQSTPMPAYGGFGGQKLPAPDSYGADNGQAWELGPDGKPRFKQG